MSTDTCFLEATSQFDHIDLHFLLSIFFMVRDSCLLVIGVGKAGVGAVADLLLPRTREAGVYPSGSG